jgi:hypothetical protein
VILTATSRQRSPQQLTASGFLCSLHKQRHAGNDLLSFPSSTTAGDIGRSGLFTNSRSAHHHHLQQQQATP